MKDEDELKKDPVCGMMVEPHQYEQIYAEIHYAFCSEQCQQRFIETPLLYVGENSKQSVKQQGLEVIKQRYLKLNKVPSAEEVELIEACIKALMGIHSIKVVGAYIDISYDLIQVTEAQIEAVLNRIDMPLAQSWVHRFRRLIIQMLEENQCSTLTSRVNSIKGCHKS